MANWDNKEREQFRIDAENLKYDVDIIQSEKISNLKDYIDTFKSKTKLDILELKNSIESSNIKNNNIALELEKNYYISGSKLKLDNENVSLKSDKLRVDFEEKISQLNEYIDSLKYDHINMDMVQSEKIVKLSAHIKNIELNLSNLKKSTEESDINNASSLLKLEENNQLLLLKLKASNENTSLKLDKLRIDFEEKNNQLKAYSKELKYDSAVENLKLKKEIKYLKYAGFVLFVLTVIGIAL